jgi:hypothetical protein
LNVYYRRYTRYRVGYVPNVGQMVLTICMKWMRNAKQILSSHLQVPHLKPYNTFWWNLVFEMDL